MDYDVLMKFRVINAAQHFSAVIMLCQWRLQLYTKLSLSKNSHTKSLNYQHSLPYLLNRNWLNIVPMCALLIYLVGNKSIKSHHETHYKLTWLHGLAQLPWKTLVNSTQPLLGTFHWPENEVQFHHNMINCFKILSKDKTHLSLLGKSLK